jgi:hypothetical protein
MLHRNKSVRMSIVTALILAVGTAIGGCRSSGTQTTRAVAGPSVPAKTGRTKAAPRLLAAKFARHIDRESAFAVYRSPAYGISFEYPRDYSLQEGDLAEESDIIENERLLADQEPGSVLVATIQVPDDAYPRTTFGHGALQLVINPSWTAESCKGYVNSTGYDMNFEKGVDADSDASSRWRRKGAAIVEGISFASRERPSTSPAGETLERDYAGFANGTCYEFLLLVSADASMSDAEDIRPADNAKIMRQLAKIVATLRIFPKTEVPATSMEASRISNR